MSRRTLPRIGTAALIALALVAPPPILAAAPNPWHSSAPEIAPAPREKTHSLHFTESMATPGPANTISLRIELAKDRSVATIAPAAAIPARQPQGTWYREIPGAVAAITFHPDGEAITAKITCNSSGAVWAVTLTGDCATTKDGTVHGVITGADLTILEAKAGAGVELATVGAQLQGLVDQPFAFRCRTTDGGLMIGKWQLGGIEGWLPTNGGLLAGKYQSAASSPVPLPLPKPSRDLELSPAFPPFPPRFAEPIPLPPPASPSANTMIPGTNCLPVPVGPAPNMCPTPPPEVLDIMVGTFGQMLGTPLPGSGAPGPCPAVPFCPQPGVMLPVPVPSSPPPVCVTVPRPSPQTVEAPKPQPLTPAGWYVAPPAPPLTAPTPVMERGQLPVGTWVREVEGIRIVIAIKDEHMTMTASVCIEEDKKIFSGSMIVTADCYARRDRVGAVGVITSVDLRVDGTVPKELTWEDLATAIRPIQKAVTESLLSLTYRVRDDVLLISDIQVVTKDNSIKYKVDDWVSSLCGQYHRATGPLPKQKPVEFWPSSADITVVRTPQDIRSTPGLPPVCGLAGLLDPATVPQGKVPDGGSVVIPMLPPDPLPQSANPVSWPLNGTPRYIPSDPAFPLPRELAIQVETAPAPREKLPRGCTVVLPMLPPDPLPLSPPIR